MEFPPHELGDKVQQLRELNLRFLLEIPTGQMVDNLISPIGAFGKLSLPPSAQS
jgi:hypothetical protein